MWIRSVRLGPRSPTPLDPAAFFNKREEASYELRRWMVSEIEAGFAVRLSRHTARTLRHSASTYDHASPAQPRPSALREKGPGRVAARRPPPKSEKRWNNALPAANRSLRGRTGRTGRTGPLKPPSPLPCHAGAFAVLALCL